MFLVGSSRALFSRFLTRFAAKREQSRYFQVHETDKGANSRKISSEPPLSSRFYMSSASKLESDGGSDESRPNRRGPDKSVGSYNLQELLDRIARAQLQRDEHLVENQVKMKTKRPKVRRTSLLSIDELVNFLREQKAHDICVLKIPPEREYVEYFVVCSGLGTRHIRVMADSLVAEVKGCGDGRGGRVRVEGRDSDDWMAVDLGAAVVHIMLDDTRRKYELEKLWALGPQYDDQFRDMQQWFQTTDTAVD